MIWWRRIFWAAFGLGAVGNTLPAQAQTSCRQALAIGMDVSGSVNAQEYTLQVNGLALALIDPEVQEALLAMPGAPVRLFVYEWAGLGHRRVLLDWTTITAASQIQEVAETLSATQSRPSDIATALGLSMEFGARALATQADCWARTLDISGDGQSNAGPRPRRVKPGLAVPDLTINALVVGADAPASTDLREVQIGELASYYSAEVIQGPNAFVETALGYEDYQAAMKRKLLRELKIFAIGALEDKSERPWHGLHVPAQLILEN